MRSKKYLKKLVIIRKRKLMGLLSSKLLMTKHRRRKIKMIKFRVIRTPKHYQG